MKKNLLSLMLIVFLIEIPIITNSVEAYSCELYFLETDKESYYLNEKVIINASWELNYNPIREYAYIQINIYDAQNKHIWNSSWYDEIGVFTELWTINTTELKTTFFNHSNKIFIEFYLYFWDGELTRPFLKASKELSIFKRIPCCELIGFKNQIKYSEDLTFIASFYDDDDENRTPMINQEVLFRISSNNSTIFQHNYTTNHLGRIEISLTSLVHLNLGLNKLIFKIIQSKIYNDSIFQYEILVDKNPVFIDVIDINYPLLRNKDFVMQIFCYYFFNNSVIPLVNASIMVEILKNQILIYSHTYNTDNKGILLITISHTILNFTKEVEAFLLILHYKGNNLLQNKTVSLSLDINQSKGKNSLNSSLILIITLSIISLTILFPLIYRFKKERKKILTEVIIKY